MRGWDDCGLITQPGTAAPSTSASTTCGAASRSATVSTREFGDHENHAIWRFGRGGLPVAGAGAGSLPARWTTWLTALKADSRDRPLEQKVRSSTPAGAADFCVLSTDVAQTHAHDRRGGVRRRPVPEAVVLAAPGGRRRRGGEHPEVPAASGRTRPNTAAGSMPAQLARAAGACSPRGVCDWSKPGVGQQDAVGPLSFSAGPGGVALAAAPMSTQVRSRPGRRGASGNRAIGVADPASRAAERSAGLFHVGYRRRFLQWVAGTRRRSRGTHVLFTSYIHERPALFRSVRPGPGRRPARVHPRRPQRAAGRRRPHHRRHAHPRLGALHPHGARRAAPR